MNNLKKELINLSVEKWEELKKEVDKMIINKEMMSPSEVLLEGDTVILFYEDLEPIIKKMREMYADESDDDIAPFSLGCEEPEILDYKFFGKEMQGIPIWFDREEENAKELYDTLKPLVK